MTNKQVLVFDVFDDEEDSCEDLEVDILPTDKIDKALTLISDKMDDKMDGLSHSGYTMK